MAFRGIGGRTMTRTPRVRRGGGWDKFKNVVGKGVGLAKKFASSNLGKAVGRFADSALSKSKFGDTYSKIKDTVKQGRSGDYDGAIRSGISAGKSARDDIRKRRLRSNSSRGPGAMEAVRGGGF